MRTEHIIKAAQRVFRSNDLRKCRVQKVHFGGKCRCLTCPAPRPHCDWHPVRILGQLLIQFRFVGTKRRCEYILVLCIHERNRTRCGPSQGSESRLDHWQ